MKTIMNERAFTLIEMLIVLMIISVLLLIVIPNMTKNNEMAAKKGCEATISLLQTQVYAYEIETGEKPDDLNDLASSENEYVEAIECPDGSIPTYDSSTGKVTPPEDPPSS